MSPTEPTPAAFRPVRRPAGPGRTDAAIREALHCAIGMPRRPMPVLVDGRIVAWVRGSGPFDPRVSWLPHQPYRLGWSNLTDLTASISALHGGKNELLKGSGSTNVACDMWCVNGNGGNPGLYSAAADTARQFDGTTAGAIMGYGAVAPATRHVIALGTGRNTNPPCNMNVLYDRVLSYENSTFTGALQTMTNGVAAQRYNGAGLPGMQIQVTTVGVTDATAADLTTLTYVDQDGNAATMPTTLAIAHVPSQAAASTTSAARIAAPSLAGAAVWGPYLPLAAEDSGARSITSFTWSAAKAGTLCFALIYPIAYVAPCDVGTTSPWTTLDQVLTTTRLGRIYDGACLSYHSGVYSATGPNNPQYLLQTAWG